MLRIWGKVNYKGRIIFSVTVANDDRELDLKSRIDRCVDEIVEKLDLEHPIWLEKNLKEISIYGRARFDQDNFIDRFPYRDLEIEIIETDETDEKKN